MNPTEIPLKRPGSVTDLSVGDVEQVERALIDASTRVPVLMFYASAVAWLLIGTVLAFFTSFKLHSPDWLSNVAFLTWGRIRPAHSNVMLYGWASMVGMGTAIWLMARLCRTTLRHPLLLVAGGAFWNLGVVLGVCGILMGDSTGFHWLEFPSYAAVTLFMAYSLIISWAVLMFRFRKGDPIYINPERHIRDSLQRFRAAGVKPEFEVFDTGHIMYTRHLIERGLIDHPAVIQICLGLTWSAPATPETLMCMKNLLPANSVWFAFGKGSMMFPMVALTVILGGHIRVGLEDTPWIAEGKLAPSNTALVEKAVAVMSALDAEPASPEEARRILGLPANR